MTFAVVSAITNFFNSNMMHLDNSIHTSQDCTYQQIETEMGAMTDIAEQKGLFRSFAAMLLCPSHHGTGHEALMSLSVCPVPDPIREWSISCMTRC